MKRRSRLEFAVIKNTLVRGPVAPVGTRAQFFASFLRDPLGVGSICPSSSHLAHATLRDTQLTAEDVVVEYGPGTGAMTSVIRDRLGANDNGPGGYLGIEREEAFYGLLRERLPDLLFAHGTVEDVQHHLGVAGLGPPKLIVSGLPLVLMPTPTIHRILRTSYEVLEPGGSFRAIHYVQSWPTPAGRRLRLMMREIFDHFELSRLVWRNLPPSYVLRGDKSVQSPATNRP